MAGTEKIRKNRKTGAKSGKLNNRIIELLFFSVSNVHRKLEMVIYVSRKPVRCDLSVLKRALEKPPALMSRYPS